jgi:hypothetical protein
MDRLTTIKHPNGIATITLSRGIQVIEYDVEAEWTALTEVFGVSFMAWACMTDHTWRKYND